VQRTCQGIAHRDLKPTKVDSTPDGKVRAKPWLHPSSHRLGSLDPKRL